MEMYKETNIFQLIPKILPLKGLKCNFPRILSYTSMEFELTW